VAAPRAGRTRALHDALPIYLAPMEVRASFPRVDRSAEAVEFVAGFISGFLRQRRGHGPRWLTPEPSMRSQFAGRDHGSHSGEALDRKSTRLNSSHVKNSYAV